MRFLAESQLPRSQPALLRRLSEDFTPLLPLLLSPDPLLEGFPRFEEALLLLGEPMLPDPVL